MGGNPGSGVAKGMHGVTTAPGNKLCVQQAEPDTSDQHCENLGLYE